MKTIYINNGAKNTNKGGIKWKLYTFLIAFLLITFSVLKVAAPTIVEKFINQAGAKSSGYAFSIRDTELSLSKGQIVLNDVKIFNPKTNTEILEAPKLTIQLNWMDLLQSQEKKISISSDQVDLVISRDFASEIKRIHETEKDMSDFYLNVVEGKFSRLNIIEQKEDQSRTVIELNDVNMKLKEFTPLAINKKTEFIVTSNIVDGGKLNLTGKTTEEKNVTSWTIQGSLKQIPAGQFNKIAGNKLPFSFNESSLDAEITAHSDQGIVSGEILPDIKGLKLIDEKPGMPTQTIARALTDELTFTLPFTLKDDLSFQYASVFTKLKNYRKYASSESSSSSVAPVSQTAKAKKTSFWPF